VRMLGEFKDVGCDGAARLARNDEVGCCSIQPVGTDAFLIRAVSCKGFVKIWHI